MSRVLETFYNLFLLHFPFEIQKKTQERMYILQGDSEKRRAGRKSPILFCYHRLNTHSREDSDVSVKAVLSGFS